MVGPKGLTTKRRLPRCRSCEWNNHSLHPAPCIHPFCGQTHLSFPSEIGSKAGIQANRYVTQYGLHLLPEFYEVYNPMSYDEARDMEVELAIDFREAGFGVWQA